MDYKLYHKDISILVHEGDIVIRNSASFKDILNALVEHAGVYLQGDYDREGIIKQFMEA